jgi:hypothetical protein
LSFLSSRWSWSAPVTPPVSAAATAANAQSFQGKVNWLAQPKDPGEGEGEVHLNSGELNAVLAQAAGLLPAAAGASGTAQEK